MAEKTVWDYMVDRDAANQSAQFQEMLSGSSLPSSGGVDIAASSERCVGHLANGIKKAQELKTALNEMALNNDKLTELTFKYKYRQQAMTAAAWRLVAMDMASRRPQNTLSREDLRLKMLAYRTELIRHAITDGYQKPNLLTGLPDSAASKDAITYIPISRVDEIFKMKHQSGGDGPVHLLALEDDFFTAVAAPVLRQAQINLLGQPVQVEDIYAPL